MVCCWYYFVTSDEKGHCRETEQRMPGRRTGKLTVEEDESGVCCHGRAAMLSAENCTVLFTHV